MFRKTGAMHHAHAAIQHLNPACRAARAFPESPVARLLMSLNDGDFPKYFEEKSQKGKWGFVYNFLEATIVVAIISFAFLPDAAQDSILTSFTNGVINGIVLGLGLLSAKGNGVWVPIVLVVGLAIILALREWRRYVKQHLKVAIAKPKEDEIEDDTVAALEEKARSSTSLRKKLRSMRQKKHDAEQELESAYSSVMDLEAIYTVNESASGRKGSGGEEGVGGRVGGGGGGRAKPSQAPRASHEAKGGLSGFLKGFKKK